MKLYFGNTTTTITTLMILCLLGFIGYTIFQRANILYWGRRTLFVLVFGLVICCFAAAETGWIRQFSTQLTAAVHREFFRSLVFRI